MHTWRFNARVNLSLALWTLFAFPLGRRWRLPTTGAWWRHGPLPSFPLPPVATTPSSSPPLSVSTSITSTSSLAVSSSSDSMRTTSTWSSSPSSRGRIPCLVGGISLMRPSGWMLIVGVGLVPREVAVLGPSELVLIVVSECRWLWAFNRLCRVFD